MTQTECRSANWYQLGERDGNQYGTRPWIDQYAHQCSRYGVAVVEKDYMTGWTDGYAEFSRRMNGGDCCSRP